MYYCIIIMYARSGLNTVRSRAVLLKPVLVKMIAKMETDSMAARIALGIVQ